MEVTSPESITAAVAVLRRGGLVGLPTETVYGLAADAENELAVRRIFAVKGRPSTHPLIVHIADRTALESWAREVPPAAWKLAEAFWPGPLTLVLPRSGRASDAVTGGQETVALRVPGHPVALAVLRSFGGGVAAPSANRFGQVSPTRAEHVRADLGSEVDLVIDGGAARVGVESTIVDLTRKEPVVLRPGGVPREELERVLGCKVSLAKGGAVRAPGTLRSHYAPRAGVLLAEPGEAIARALALSSDGARVAVAVPEGVDVPEALICLRIPGEVEGLARELYALLRAIDAAGVDIGVVSVPREEGLGLAIVDRLRRAAAPRGAGS
jgi:L-threonylcarbamoyladenylate synthase